MRTGQKTGTSERISESFQYCPDGRLKTAIAGGMRYEYAYDVRGRLKSKSASGKELISYGYDLNGNKISQRDVTGNVTEYRYGISDELLEIYDKGVLRASYEYNPDGTVKRQKTGKGTEILTDTCYTYDGDRNLIGLKTFLQGGWQKDYKTEPVPLVCNAYGYDRNGNRTFKETIGGRTEYEYDSRNRLEMVRYPDRWEKFGYDPAGNRKSRVTGEVEENYIYDVRNRLIQVIRTAGNGVTPLAEGIKAGTAEAGYGTVKAEEEVWRYEYDRQGNLLKDNYAEYSYDGFNRMEKAETFTGKIQVNHYDAEGLRHEIEENGRLVSFIFSDREVVAESSKEDTIRYIRRYDILCSDSECARTYYHYVCDEDGSTSHILDETGKVLNQYEYDAFGNLIKAQEEVNNRFLYVGQQYDGVTMQYYLRARYYNPVVARFMQEDTYRGDGLSLYTYCQNNPVGYYDPSGHSTDGCGIGKNGNSKSGRYTEVEIKSIIDNLKGDGFKNNPLRQAYENEVAGLKAYGDKLLASGMSEEQVARTLNQARRDLGIKYKNATPQPLRDYIYEVNMGRYGDKLGPTYDWLVNEKGATNMEIINSSSRPNSNIDKLLSGFEEWLRRQ